MPNAADLDEALAVAGKLTPYRPPTPLASSTLTYVFLTLLLHFQSNQQFESSIRNPTFNGL